MTMKRRPYWIALLVLVLLLGLYVFTIGPRLVRDEQPQQADAIVVLLGKTPERILEAVQLYDEGYASTILLVETLVEHEAILRDAGVTVPLGTAAEQEIALQLGVPAEAITVIPGETESTQDEAVALRDYLSEQEDPLDSLLLVTSKSHSYRSSLIFERALRQLEEPVEVISVPSRLGRFEPRGWFRDREKIQEVLAETAKLINYWLIDRWKL